MACMTSFQLAEINLLSLDRFAAVNIEHHMVERLTQAIFKSDRFASLRVCQLEFNDAAHLKLARSNLSQNNVLRSFALNKCSWDGFGTLLRQLCNLRRLETSFDEAYNSATNALQPQLSIHHLIITLKDCIDDLKKILRCTPNLTRLRIRGNLGETDAFEHFEEMARLFPVLTPRLQHFDCELYCVSFSNHGNELVIRQLHPLFKKVQCLSGQGGNQCYATNITTYPNNDEYEREHSSMTMCLFFLRSASLIYFHLESLPQNRSFRQLNSIDMNPYHDHWYENDHNAYDDDDYDDDYDERYSAWERNEYGNGPDMYCDAESDEWCRLP